MINYQCPTITYIKSRSRFQQQRYETISSKLLEDEPHLRDITCVESLPELFPRFSDPNFYTDFVAFDIEHLYSVPGTTPHELLQTLRTLIACTVCRIPGGGTGKRTTKIICSVSEDTDPAMIKDVMKMVDRIAISVGQTWDYPDIREDVALWIRGDTTMPKKVLDLIRPKNVRTIRVKQRSGEIHLTPRQRQIFNLISTRGASNKAIAKLLDISESTVKLHTSAILKKYGVKSRTQLAVFAQAKDKEKVSAP